MRNASIDEVAAAKADAGTGSSRDQAATAEFLRRQTDYLRQAAEAAQASAESTKKYTQYMFWSVVLLALSVVATLVLDVIRFVIGR